MKIIYQFNTRVLGEFTHQLIKLLSKVIILNSQSSMVLTLRKPVTCPGKLKSMRSSTAWDSWALAYSTTYGVLDPGLTLPAWPSLETGLSAPARFCSDQLIRLNSMIV